jgi:bifunctional non-homologous end joining protein LigD
MLSRPGPLPSGSGWSFELKWDGFRALVSTEDGLRVRSRRGWNMTGVLSELCGLPAGLLLDGELVAWKKSQPHFPLVCRRVLNGDVTIPLTYVIFDVLRRDGDDLTGEPYVSRRTTLHELQLDGPSWMTSETFEDGPALFDAVCGLGLEGVVAKRLTSRYGPNRRGWVKTKNPNYWRRDFEREAMQRSRERVSKLACGATSNVQAFSQAIPSLSRSRPRLA